MDNNEGGVAYFIGKIYFYEATPVLKEALKDSDRYKYPEGIKLALARMGEKKYYDIFLTKIKVNEKI